MNFLTVFVYTVSISQAVPKFNSDSYLQSHAIIHVYLHVLLYGVAWNEMVRLPPGGKVAVCGVRPEDTMECCGVSGGRLSRNQNSVEVLLWRTLSRIQ